MPEPAWGKATRWLSVILIDPAAFGADREEVRQALEQAGIESRPVWKPLHLQPAFRGAPSTAPAMRCACSPRGCACLRARWKRQRTRG